ncbi:chemotaxis response regulator protein-glutamate methylesterase [mine drainage metagenome]|uniref:protein-glutamate methylesterase n=1 Tax=mine drainage metagenome TaxID=410659 RepID=A0A1J5SST8_9ZZZZ
MSREITVLIVDDSAVVRQVMTEILAREPGIRVLGAAADPLFALEKMRREWPDVITLDVEMPRMDGITFLKKLMAERPTPVVICSSLTQSGAETSIEALAAGALAIIAKPTLGLKDFLHGAAGDVVAAVRAAAQARLRCLVPMATTRPTFSLRVDPGEHQAMSRTTEGIVAIGTSTGGTQALEVLLTVLPRVAPGMVIVQHMPEKFTALFAQRLDGICEIEVREAQNGDRVVPGLALIAPGGRHMKLCRSGAQYLVQVIDGPQVNRHKPSVDVLFRSVAQVAGKNALGVIMTGMGDDGARGLKTMHDAGARTIAQDEETCVVYGMPKEAVKLGAVDKIVSLQHIGAILSALGQEGLSPQDV